MLPSNLGYSHARLCTPFWAWVGLLVIMAGESWKIQWHTMIFPAKLTKPPWFWSFSWIKTSPTTWFWMNFSMTPEAIVRSLQHAAVGHFFLARPWHAGGSPPVAQRPIAIALVRGFEVKKNGGFYREKIHPRLGLLGKKTISMLINLLWIGTALEIVEIGGKWCSRGSVDDMMWM